MRLVFVARFIFALCQQPGPAAMLAPRFFTPSLFGPKHAFRPEKAPFKRKFALLNPCRRSFGFKERRCQAIFAPAFFPEKAAAKRFTERFPTKSLASKFRTEFRPEET